MNTWTQYILPALIGLIGVFAGYRVKWDIEKRRLQLQARAHLLTTAREFISSEAYSHPKFITSALYSQLLPHLSRNCRKSISDKATGAPNTIAINVGGRDAGVNTQHRSLLLDEIARLEKTWDII